MYIKSARLREIYYSGVTTLKGYYCKLHYNQSSCASQFELINRPFKTTSECQTLSRVTK